MIGAANDEEAAKALGAKITMIGDDNVENNRLHKAWQAFHKHKNIRCHKMAIGYGQRGDTQELWRGAFAMT